MQGSFCCILIREECFPPKLQVIKICDVGGRLYEFQGVRRRLVGKDIAAAGMIAVNLQEEFMGKTIVAVTGGVVLGLAIAFANAGAFQFPWGSGGNNSASQTSAQNQPAANHRPAPPNAPEPNEPAVALPSWAPLVKRVMPT